MSSTASAKSSRLPPEHGWHLVAAPGDGAAAFRAIALDHDSELVGVQRVAGSERCVGIAAVAAPGVVEQDSLLPVVHGFPGRQGLRRGAVPVAFRDGAGGSGPVSVSAACRLSVDDRHVQPPFLSTPLDCPIMRKPLVPTIGARGLIALFGCGFGFQRLVPVVVAGCAACVGSEREEPYSEGRESHPSTSFA